MKTRYIKIFGIPYYTREEKRFPWSKWHVHKNDIGQILPYRYVAGRFEPEWKWSGPDEKDIELAKK